MCDLFLHRPSISASSSIHPSIHVASEGGVMMNGLQAAQELFVGAARRRHGLKDGLEGAAVQLLVDLVPVEVHGHQAEEVDVHYLAAAHPADDVGQQG